MLLLACLSLVAATAPAQAVVSGAVVNASNHGIPGLSVYLVHSVAGRSSRTITDDYGRFFVKNVPIRNDRYYLEVWWGKTLMARRAIVVQHDTNVGTIVLK